MSKIYEIFGSNAHTMTKELMEAGKIITKIPSGAQVALKPNLVVAKSFNWMLMGVALWESPSQKYPI